MNKLYKKGCNFANRFITTRLVRKDFVISQNKPVISFTFDDFPQSAAEVGLDLLNKYNIRATFYISFGLLEKDSVVGKICNLNNIETLVNSGHNLGCHTFNHRGAFEQSTLNFENSLIENQNYLRKIYPEFKFSVFSYPKGQVKPATKKLVQKYYIASRGIIPGINKDKIDLNLLKGTSIYGDIDNFNCCKKFIDLNISANGWLIFYTHDIDKYPSPFGCTPELFEKVLKYSLNSGAEVIDIEHACNLIHTPL